MKKDLIGPIITVIVVILLTAMFVYFYISLNRLDKQTVALRDTTVTQSNQVTAIINFFNANANAQSAQN